MIRAVLVPFLLTRLALLAAALAAPLFVPRAEGSGIWDPTGQPWLDVWTRWDGLEYLLIAHEGYSYRPGQQSSIAFSPLYAAVLKLGELIEPGSGYTGSVVLGLLASNLALLAALYFLYRLVERDFDAATAARAVTYVLVFPTTLFFSALYPESLLLAGVLGALYAARGGHWWIAGVLGFACALIRPYGALVAVPLAYEYLAQRKFNWRAVRPNILALALIPAGFLAWIAYATTITGDPRAVFDAQNAWGRQLGPPWQSFLQFFSAPLEGHGSLHSPLDLGFALLFLALVAVAWSRVRPAYALYATVLYLLLVSSGPLISLMRNGLQLFPIFIVLAYSGRHRLFHLLFVAASFLFALRLMAAFAQGYWVA